MISSLELARLCGVSQGTVDRALHGRTGIAEATRERILRLAAEHGYAANPVASELMGRRPSGLVAAVAPEGSLQHHFFASLTQAIGARLRSEGLRLLVTWGGGAGDTRAAIRDLAARRMRALLLVHPDSDITVGQVGCPILALVQPCEGLPSLLPDEAATGSAAAIHLLERGHRRMIALVSESSPVGRQRRDGFLATAQTGSASVEVTRSIGEAVDAISRQRATAIFCHNDPYAAGVITALSAKGLRVPEDVSVIGVDGAGLLPGLTTVAYPFAAIADGVATWITAGRLPSHLTRPGILSGQTTGPAPP